MLKESVNYPGLSLSNKLSIKHYKKLSKKHLEKQASLKTYGLFLALSLRAMAKHSNKPTLK